MTWISPLDEGSSLGVAQGVAAVLSEVGAQAGLPPAPLHTFREVHSPVARLYNWNLLQPILHAFSVHMDVDDKALVVAGGDVPGFQNEITNDWDPREMLSTSHHAVLCAPQLVSSRASADDMMREH
jgi:hypothetical protein